MAQSILPNVDVTVLDGALGLASGTRDGVCAQIGESSLGDHLVHPVTDPGQVAALFGAGPLPDAIRDALGSGARMVLARRVVPGIAGSVGYGDPIVTNPPPLLVAPSADGGNTSTGALTASELAAQSADESGARVEIEIVDGGDRGVATFKWRARNFDGGVLHDWSQPIATAATVEIGPLIEATGSVLLHWGEGNYAASDQWVLYAILSGLGGPAWGGEPPSLGGQIEVEVTGTGGNNEATVIVRLDGQVVVPEQTVPTDGVISVPGLGQLQMAEWPDGDTRSYSWIEGTIYRFVAVASISTLSSIAEAVRHVMGHAVTPEVIHVVGATSPATWAGLHALAEGFAAEGKFLHVLCETALPEDEESESEWIASIAEGVESAGSLRRVSLYSGWVWDGDDARSGAARYLGHLMARQKVSHSPGRVIDGPVRGVSVFGPTDDGAIAALDALGCTTMRRIDGLGGAYVTNGRMLVDDTSDFRWVEWRRVMDKACREVRLAAIRYLHFGMDAEGLRALQVQCQAALNRMVAAGECAGGAVEIPEGQDIIGTSTVRAKVRVQPIPSARWVDVEIAFAAQV